MPRHTLTEAQKAALISFAERFPDVLDAVLSRDEELIGEQFDQSLADDQDDKDWCSNNEWETEMLRMRLRPTSVLKAAE